MAGTSSLGTSGLGRAGAGTAGATFGMSAIVVPTASAAGCPRCRASISCWAQRCSFRPGPPGQRSTARATASRTRRSDSSAIAVASGRLAGRERRTGQGAERIGLRTGLRGHSSGQIVDQLPVAGHPAHENRHADHCQHQRATDDQHQAHVAAHDRSAYDHGSELPRRSPLTPQGGGRLASLPWIGLPISPIMSSSARWEDPLRFGPDYPTRGLLTCRGRRSRRAPGQSRTPH